MKKQSNKIIKEVEKKQKIVNSIIKKYKKKKLET